MFERRRKRNIALYASKEKLAARGRFYNEDDLAPFDVLDYDIDVTALPDRQWVEGRAMMRLRVRTPSLGQLTIRLADTLVVRSVISDKFGRLFSLRVTNQNTILVNLPTLLAEDTEITLTIAVQRAARAADAGPGNAARRAGRRRRKRCRSRVSGGCTRSRGRAELSLQQPELLVPAVDDQRLRDRQDPHHRAGRVRLRGYPANRPDSPRGDYRTQCRSMRATSTCSTRSDRSAISSFIVSRFIRADRRTVAFDDAAVSARRRDARRQCGALTRSST